MAHERIINRLCALVLRPTRYSVADLSVLLLSDDEFLRPRLGSVRRSLCGHLAGLSLLEAHASHSTRRTASRQRGKRNRREGERGGGEGGEKETGGRGEAAVREASRRGLSF
eukprot:scaffold63831_cov28-Tisochrysis_lutea.AAC.1